MNKPYNLGPELTIRFSYVEDDCDSEVLPLNFYIANRSGEYELFGDPTERDQVKDLCRFIAYRLKKDDIDTNKFIRNFQETVRQICDHFNKDYIEANRLEVYGDFDNKTGFFVPRRYEFNVYEPKKYFGELVLGENSKELIFATNQNIVLTQNAVYFDQPLIVTDSIALGKTRDKDEHIRKYKAKIGQYNFYRVFRTTGSGEKKLVAACLLHRDDNFHSVYWENQNLYITNKLDNSYWMLGPVKTDFTGKAMELVKEGVSFKLEDNFAGFLNQVDKDNGSQYSEWYLARDIKGQIIGFAFETLAQEPGQRKNLNNLV